MGIKAELLNMNDRYARLGLIEALTEKMLLNARQHQWDVVSKVETERSKLIYAFFETPPTLEEAEHVAVFIRNVLVADKEIIALGSNEQRGILKSSQDITRGKQASLAYTAHHRINR